MDCMYRRFGFAGLPPIPLILPTLLLSAAVGNAAADIYRSAAWGTPTIDGVWSEGEWDNDRIIVFDHGVITFVHDFVRLYVLVDVIDDTTEDPPDADGDTVQLFIDRNEDYEVSDFDVVYQLTDDTYNYRYAHYPSPFVVEPVSVSSIARGFDCFFQDGTRTEMDCGRHTIWEIALDYNEIAASWESTVRLGIRVQSGSSGFDDHIPAAVAVDDFNQMINVSLAPPPAWMLLTTPSDTISFDESPPVDAIEVTQSIQSRENAMPLVAEKDTVARLYIRGTPDPSAVVAYLHGTRGGNDLPGSPLAKLQYVGEDFDRERLYDTANFALPASWTGGTIVLQGRAVGVDVTTGTYTADALSTPLSVQFTPKRTPLYWVIRANAAAPGDPPVQGIAFQMAGQQDYLETVFPVPDVDFRELGWEYLGALDSLSVTDDGELDTEYEDYERPLGGLWLGALLGAALSDNWEGFPDQIYAFAPAKDHNDDGTAYDGLAFSGGGVTAVGTGDCDVDDDGNLLHCRLHVMAHEINHNLDRGDPRTWGSHVTNPDDPFDRDWGCGAERPDLEWASLWSDDEIREIGFNPQEPWEDGPGRLATDRYNRYTVIPSDFPDFMSYCGQLVYEPGLLQVVVPNPRNWISGYRWEHLFCALPFPNLIVRPADCGGLLQSLGWLDELRRGESQPAPALYVSGMLGWKADTPYGALAPAFSLPGVPEDGTNPGEYAIELQDTQGATLVSKSFAVSFEGSEGQVRDRVLFNLQVPTHEDAARLLLKKDGQVLDALEVSEHAPTVTVLKPAAGAFWDEGERRIRWSASDPDGDPLTFAILYTPDQGESWHPVAWAVQGEYYDLDPIILPGGQAAQIRVIATDGFNTSADDSEPFSVANKAPDASITRPTADAEFGAGEAIRFEGRGYDAEDGFLADEAFTWFQETRPIGAGRKLMAHLPEGRHQIRLRVKDSQGLTNEDSIEIAVFADADGDRVADPSDNCRYTPNPDQEDRDGDGVGTVCDVCSDTLIPEPVPTRRLGVNRFALVDSDGIFDTAKPKGKGPDRHYTLADTWGCSCSQIIERLGLGKGHVKFGCSIGVMDRALSW